MSSNSSSQSWGLFVAIILAGIVVAATLYFTNDNEVTDDYAVAQVSPRAQKKEIKGVLDEDVQVNISDTDISLGNINAPILIVEFSEWECSFCTKFHREVFPKLKKDFIDTGLVRFVFKDFPLSNIHPQSRIAAEATYCADDQGKFWEYVDSISKDSFKITKEELVGSADEIGLEKNQFIKCLDGEKHADNIVSNTLEAIRLGVIATPTFVVNGRMYEGVLSFQSWQDIINTIISQ